MGEKEEEEEDACIGFTDGETYRVDTVRRLNIK